MAYSNLVPPKRAEYHPTFTTIHRRLKNLGIHLYNHIDSDLKVYESNLDGVFFNTKKKTDPLKHGDFLSSLRAATTLGKPAFREGKKFDKAHWAVDASMAATTGIGFREITYLGTENGPRITRSGSALSMRGPGVDAPFSAQFGKTRARLDISSLHCAVWGHYCSVHVDEAGFVIQAMPGLSNDVMMTPDFLQHTLLELIWKDKLGVPDAVEIFVPNSKNDYSSMGIRATAKLGRNVRVSVNASYNVRGKRGFSKTIVLQGEM